jgi:hypothetical protein
MIVSVDCDSMQAGLTLCRRDHGGQAAAHLINQRSIHASTIAPEPSLNSKQGWHLYLIVAIGLGPSGHKHVLGLIDRTPLLSSRLEPGAVPIVGQGCETPPIRIPPREFISSTVPGQRTGQPVALLRPGACGCGCCRRNDVRLDSPPNK